MPRFQFQVRDSLGHIDNGAMAADSIDAAAGMLRRDGRVIMNLHEETQSPQAPAPAGPLKKIKRDDILYFTNMLAVMVDTGVPITEALAAIADQSDHSGLKALLCDVSNEVTSGTEFSKALEKHPRHFSKLFVAMIRASEASGTMGLMLSRLSDYMVQERDTVKRIKGAMIYPACMLTFCMIAVTGLLVFVLPRFEGIYKSKGAELPLPTQILMTLSNGLRDHWLLILGLLAASITAIVMFARSPGGRIFFDGLRIRVPILGQMYRKAYLSRSLRTMATMVSTGVTVLEGLSLTAQVAGNYYYEKIWLDVAEKVKEGSTLSDELMKAALVPRTVTQMISAGERTGKLSVVMNRVAQFCEEDLKVAVKTLTTMIEPAMIIFMGLLIGGIAMALLLPNFTMSKVMAK